MDSRRVLELPAFPDLSASDVQAIQAYVNEAWKAYETQESIKKSTEFSRISEGLICCR